MDAPTVIVGDLTSVSFGQSPDDDRQFKCYIDDGFDYLVIKCKRGQVPSYGAGGVVMEIKPNRTPIG